MSSSRLRVTGKEPEKENVHREVRQAAERSQPEGHLEMKGFYAGTRSAITTLSP